mmetsp:Transcript_8002/g.17399  ORF Transcript_8002/g.17399 Transcript_8002/m.17399 type:complete len:123 (+) Transcript_8002:585-953(+)
MNPTASASPSTVGHCKTKGLHSDRPLHFFFKIALVITSNITNSSRKQIFSPSCHASSRRKISSVASQPSAFATNNPFSMPPEQPPQRIRISYRAPTAPCFSHKTPPCVISQGAPMLYFFYMY